MAAVAAAFVTLGLALPLAIDAPVLGLYRQALVHAVGEPDPRTWRLLLGITGASIAGKWVAHLALVPYLARGERWAWRASVIGLASWFAVDSLVSLAHGAWWNVAFVNLVPPATFGACLALARHRRWSDERAPELVRGSAAWWALLAAAIGTTSGAVIALGGSSVLFDPWREALAAAHGASNDAFVASFFGPIGGSTLAQFAMLGMLARHAVARGDRRALDWILASILAWLVPDSLWSLASAGAFNVWLVNLPFAALCVPPVLAARWRGPRAP
ncbi:MAG: hypothetical protein K1X94_13660 [Sandaracinaceae bacterium]|nr:hypothetical protein [Sandaracinaceae bacterium]